MASRKKCAFIVIFHGQFNTKSQMRVYRMRKDRNDPLRSITSSSAKRIELLIKQENIIFSHIAISSYKITAFYNIALVRESNV